MKLLVLALTFAMATAASAQRLEIPKTITLTNKATGEKIGTATFSENRAYLRDRNGEHYATVVVNPDGTKTIYDPHGKVIEMNSLSLTDDQLRQ